MQQKIKILLCFLSLSISTHLFAQNTQPNIVFILADDLGYGDLAAYGHRHIKTPHLDKLADEGIKFTNFYSPSPLCSPARAGFLTGRTPYRTGIQSWIPQEEDIYLHPEEKTIATLLKAQGYQTFLAGKWHLNGGLADQKHTQPDKHGFDKWLALHAFALPTHKNPNNFYEDGKAMGEMEGFSAQIAVDKSIDYLRHRDKDKPFFLYLPMAEVEIDLKNLKNRGPGEYFANVTYMDHQIGRLLESSYY